MDIPGRIETLDELTALYREPGGMAVDKQRSTIDPGMARFIDLCPFVVVATTDADQSIDASPRGGPPGFVRRLDDRHIAVPDLNGNNRLDTYRNIIAHPWAGLLMMIPGKEETLRINGPATLTVDPEILSGFTKELRTPKVALVIETAEVYGHCAKAFRRGKLWQPESWTDLDTAPDLAEMYECVLDIDADTMRSDLAGAYKDQLAQD